MHENFPRKEKNHYSVHHNISGGRKIRFFPVLNCATTSKGPNETIHLVNGPEKKNEITNLESDFQDDVKLKNEIGVAVELWRRPSCLFKGGDNLPTSTKQSTRHPVVLFSILAHTLATVYYILLLSGAWFCFSFAGSCMTFCDLP